MIVVDNKYSIGEVVYLLTDEDQEKRIVTAIKILSGNYILYGLSKSDRETYHADIEITKQKNYSL